MNVIPCCYDIIWNFKQDDFGKDKTNGPRGSVCDLKINK